MLSVMCAGAACVVRVMVMLTVAERSRLYNDLIAEVNGFRRHFFLRQKMHPKEAYRQARKRQEAESSRGEWVGCHWCPYIWCVIIDKKKSALFLGQKMNRNVICWGREECKKLISSYID